MTPVMETKVLYELIKLSISKTARGKHAMKSSKMAGVNDSSEFVIVLIKLRSLCHFANYCLDLSSHLMRQTIIFLRKF